MKSNLNGWSRYFRKVGTLPIEIGHILGKAERQNKTKKDKNAQRTYKNWETFYGFLKGHSHVYDYLSHERSLIRLVRRPMLASLGYSKCLPPDEMVIHHNLQ